MKPQIAAIHIVHKNGSRYYFPNTSYKVYPEVFIDKEIPSAIIEITTKEFGNISFSTTELQKLVIDGIDYLNSNSKSKWDCLTVKELKDILNNPNVRDDAKIYYERIEDVYFEEHGWKNECLMDDDWFNRFDPDCKGERWIKTYEAFYNKDENRLKITAHY